jgi:hypothetical protein
MALVTACSLLNVHQARIRRIYNNIEATTESLWAEWYVLLCEIVLAKRRTAIERGTFTRFCARWRNLLRFMKPALIA